MLTDLTQRETFILEAVSKGKGVVNGQTWKSLTHKGYVAGEPSEPKVTPTGKTALEKALRSAPPKEEFEFKEESPSVPPPAQPAPAPAPAPVVVERGWRVADIGLIASCVALLVCVLVICAQRGKLQDAQADIQKLTIRLAEDEKAMEVAGLTTDHVHSDSASRAETNAKVAEIKKHLDSKIQDLLKSKEARR